jgi:hypothetical protein
MCYVADFSRICSAKSEAEEYMSQQRKLVTKKAVLYQLHLKDAADELEQQTGKKALLDEKLAAEKEKLGLCASCVGVCMAVGACMYVGCADDMGSQHR